VPQKRGKKKKGFYVSGKSKLSTLYQITDLKKKKEIMFKELKE
jgi:hypothetical protein